MLVALALLFASPGLRAFQVEAVTGNPRVDRLLAQMTEEEKLTLIHDGPEDPATYQ